MASKVFMNGLDLEGNLLSQPFDETDFSGTLRQSLMDNVHELQGAKTKGAVAKSFRGEIEHTIIDLADPKKSGWTYLVNSETPNLDEIKEIMKPLAVHREMNIPNLPLLYNGEEDEWLNWIEENYYSLILENKQVPHYILLVGTPDLIPFKFQSLLDSAASVGRICFDSNDELETYVKKIIRIENEEPSLRKNALVFAPDGGIGDATFFSRNYMAEPLSNHINQLGFETVGKFGDDATKNNLINELDNAPAFVYTASHGVGAINETLDIQKKFNGAICCQEETGQPYSASLFTADDVPNDDISFLEGSIFFQFACYGYGTPAESDFMHWLGKPELNSEEDFVAALPKRLLAHPKGPIAYGAHLDTAWLHGFNDPDNPYISEKWDKRIAPFVSIINTLLKDFNPIGPSLADMNKRFDISNIMLTSTLNKLKTSNEKNLSKYFSKIADLFITRTDAQNYMVFGDPAARPHIKKG